MRISGSPVRAPVAPPRTRTALSMRAQKALLRLFAAGVTHVTAQAPLTVRLASSSAAAPASNFLRFTDPVPRVHSYTPLLATVPTQARIRDGRGGGHTLRLFPYDLMRGSSIARSPHGQPGTPTSGSASDARPFPPSAREYSPPFSSICSILFEGSKGERAGPVRALRPAGLPPPSRAVATAQIRSMIRWGEAGGRVVTNCREHPPGVDAGAWCQGPSAGARASPTSLFPDGPVLGVVPPDARRPPPPPAGDDAAQRPPRGLGEPPVRVHRHRGRVDRRGEPLRGACCGG